MPSPPTSALDDIATERQRQIAMEGWSHEHDDKNDNYELSRAAACYAMFVSAPDEVRGDLDGRAAFWGSEFAHIRRWWPWDWQWWKPKDRRRDLVRAGALIVAEIERLDRAEQNNR